VDIRVLRRGVLRFCSGKNISAHRDGGSIFVGAGLFLMCFFDGSEEQGSTNSLPHVVKVVVDRCVVFVALVTTFHWLDAFWADVCVVPCFQYTGGAIYGWRTVVLLEFRIFHPIIRAMKFLSFVRVFRARDLFCSFCGQALAR
jgi:hypothetical protein